MFELEVDHERLTSEAIPDDIKKQFQTDRASVRGYALLPWEEHCTECAMPQCYETCDLYEARKDGKCRRFIGGISPLAGVDEKIVRVAFKRWGQLMAYANLHMLPRKRAEHAENLLSVFETFASKFPDQRISLRGRRALSSRLMRRLKQAIAKKGLFKDSAAGDPHHFLLEIYNPDSKEVRLSLVISNTSQSEYNMGYQELIELKPGFNRITIDFHTIAQRLDLNKDFAISLNPNILDASDEGLTLYFGMLTFIWADEDEITVLEKPSPTVKVIAWDLDNTVWDGILIEDGADKLIVKPGITDIIRELDRRGILNTAVSKNDPDDALAQLERIGLREYFVYPKIGWGQKGQYIRELIKDFNVGANTFAFIDDSPFERDEVQSLNPDVRVYDALLYDSLLARPEFNPPLSTESHLRRQLYQVEKTRNEALSTFDGEYMSFLRECQIVLNIAIATEDRIDRIQELVQRTNQLNFSGNRYSREQIEQILQDDRRQAFIIDCRDKYGQYGTIGFAIVDLPRATLVDLMFSCRVQSKRVEHAFIAFLLSYYKRQDFPALYAEYKKSDRNMKSGAVFSDMNFSVESSRDALTVYRFDLADTIPEDGVIEINWSGETCPQ